MIEAKFCHFCKGGYSYCASFVSPANAFGMVATDENSIDEEETRSTILSCIGEVELAFQSFQFDACDHDGLVCLLHERCDWKLVDKDPDCSLVSENFGNA